MAKNTFQAIREIRSVLRDATMPEPEIIDAINRVLRDINVMGPFRFHEATYTLNLAANTYNYAVPGNVQSERLFVYAAGNNSLEREVPRKRDQWAALPTIPTDSGNYPTEWARYNNQWIVYPIPNALAAAENITVFYDLDLSEVLSPTDSIGIPDRHFNVVVYGAAAQLRPNIMVASPEGNVTVEVMYNKAIANMKNKERFDFNKRSRMKSGPRFNNMSGWGNVDYVRGNDSV